jgi:hypothetical protein
MGNLNKFLPDEEIPECLKGKLEFGNREQINALKYLENKIEKIASESEEGEYRKFFFEIERTGYYHGTVYATSYEKARKEAEDLAEDICDLDFQYERHGVSVWEANLSKWNSSA